MYSKSENNLCNYPQKMNHISSTVWFSKKVETFVDSSCFFFDTFSNDFREEERKLK